MNIEEIREYCLSLDSEVEEKFPFVKFKYGEDVLVFYIMGHMFCFFSINDLSHLTVKCQPERIVELEEQYPYIGKPFNENAKYWIGIDATRADADVLQQLIANSYEIVKAKYTKKPQKKKSTQS